MGNIVLLDDLTINKIAAGEVIERPASVVKEMMENSIDAGATNITVEIKNGGISYIRITDNGKGIAKDDMELAFERHATSKIREAKDLETVTSMGFRGEALASIAAVAHVEMVSRTKDADNGYKVVIEGGNILESEEVGCPMGTTITVTNLFYNTPVRYKFLRKDFTESGYIEDVVTRIALVNTNVSIRLINTGKTIIQTNGSGDIKNVIYNIYGKQIAESILEVEYPYEDIKVTGVVGKPEIARSNRSNQLFFVNHRFVKDKTLTGAAEQAFKGMITVGKYGFLILNLEMNPSKLDVNVHPAKLEVRFEEEQKVFKAVYHAIKDTLLKGELVKSSEVEEQVKPKEIIEEVDVKNRMDDPKFSKGLFGLFRKEPEIEKVSEIVESKENLLEDIYNTRQIKVVRPEEIEIKSAEEVKEQKEKIEKDSQVGISNENQTMNDILAKIAQMQQSLVEKKEETAQSIEDKQVEEQNSSMDDTKVMVPSMVQEDNKKKLEEPIDIKEMLMKLNRPVQEEKITPEDFEEMYMKTFGKMPPKDPNEITKEEVESIASAVQYAEMNKEDNISIFKEEEKNKKPEYKLVGIAFSTYIVIEMKDELYIIDQHAAHERIMYEKIKKNYDSGEKDSQLMLLPDIITLTHKEMLVAQDNMEMFEKAGFMLEEFGENTIKLTGVPNICIDLDTKELFLETLDEINTVARTAKQEIEEKFIATIACKAAVKANMTLDKEEIDHLMTDLLKLPNPFTCPHGRPTAIKMTKTDIEKKFSRR
ncbi:MAG: DNA mismatch repair endonuclease MutL [Clostridia bacterium]